MNRRSQFNTTKIWYNDFQMSTNYQFQNYSARDRNTLKTKVQKLAVLIFKSLWKISSHNDFKGFRMQCSFYLNRQTSVGLHDCALLCPSRHMNTRRTLSVGVWQVGHPLAMYLQQCSVFAQLEQNRECPTWDQYYPKCDKTHIRCKQQRWWWR